MVNTFKVVFYYDDLSTWQKSEGWLKHLTNANTQLNIMGAEFIKQWQFASKEDIAHGIVMTNVTRLKNEKFVKELM